MRDGIPRDRHHRRQESRGGVDCPRNLIKVSIREHRAWTGLSEYFHPETTARIINHLYSSFLYPYVVCFYVVKKDDYLVHTLPYFAYDDNIYDLGRRIVNRKTTKSWNTLFNECVGDPQKIVDIINNTWLDPDYEMRFDILGENYFEEGGGDEESTESEVTNLSDLRALIRKLSNNLRS